MNLPDVILAERVIPVVRGLAANRAQELAAALAEGGVTSLEVTMESGEAAAAIRALSGTDTTVGAGTVMTVDEGRPQLTPVPRFSSRGITAATAAAFIAAGAIAVGVGSWLTGEEDLSVVSERAQLLREAVSG